MNEGELNGDVDKRYERDEYARDTSKQGIETNGVRVMRETRGVSETLCLLRDDYRLCCSK